LKKALPKGVQYWGLLSTGLHDSCSSLEVTPQLYTSSTEEHEKKIKI